MSAREVTQEMGSRAAVSVLSEERLSPFPGLFLSLLCLIDDSYRYCYQLTTQCYSLKTFNECFVYLPLKVINKIYKLIGSMLHLLELFLYNPSLEIT